MNSRVTKFCAFVLALSLPGSAGPAAVGIVTARGSFLVNGSPVPGNATLLEGSTVATLKASSRLRLSSGATLQLAPAAIAQVYGDRVLLLKGTGEITGRPGFRMESAGLRIETGGSARLQVIGERSVTVAALKTPARIFNSEGEFVTEIQPDTAISLEQEASAPSSSQGCMIEIGGRFVVLDQSGTAGVEVRGAMLPPAVNTRVEIKGRELKCAEPLEGTDRVVKVQEMKNLAGESCSRARDQFLAAHPTSATERKTKNKCKVVAGVIIAGAAAGIAAAVCCKDEKQPISVQ